MTEPHPDFSSPQVQWALLQQGNQRELIAWLIWNDLNGIWTDEDSITEGICPITVEVARAAMRKALADCTVRAGPMIGEFDPKLPEDADKEACRAWLRQVCRTFGLGFHLDMPATEYLADDGTPLSADVVHALDDSLEPEFALPGDELPYAVCFRECETMLFARPEL